MPRLLAIGFIWLGCTLAWVILGSTIVSRTNDVGNSLDSQVHSLFGPPGRQLPPTGTFNVNEVVKETVTTTPNGGLPVQQVVERVKLVPQSLVLDRSNIEVEFDLQHRKKGLLWFPTYTVQFAAEYTFKNPSKDEQKATLQFPLNGSSNLGFDGFHVTDINGSPVEYRIHNGSASWEARFAGGQLQQFRVGYRTCGTSDWQYQLTQGEGEVKNFELHMKTGFANVDFPSGTMSPTQHAAAHGRWQGHWKYASLVAGSAIGIEMPQLLNPGPLASKVTFFAPVSLLFFYFVVAILATVQRREMHPMHYLLIGCAFFAFHLLFVYLIDQFALIPSFAIASAVSLFLVVSYARLFVGWRFALREMGISQLMYLVLFSHTFFWNGFTGLAVTIGAVMTLFVVMQISGRVNWSEHFRRGPEQYVPPQRPADATTA
ncbi:MAG TPA: inner membrane CreD family protein [Polyangiaceae bacterium]